MQGGDKMDILARRFGQCSTTGNLSGNGRVSFTAPGDVPLRT